VKATLKVRVESTTPLPETAAPPAEAKKEEPKTEKRGRRPEMAPAKAEGAEKKARPAKPEKPARAEKPPKAEKPAKPQKTE
jgi:hypothetical protein